jgi:predicted nucleic acid-binding protein
VSWLLDTDVICLPARRHGDARVIAWLEKEQDRCYTSAVVIAQLAYWVRTKEGRRPNAALFERIEHPDSGTPGVPIITCGNR